MKEIFEWKRLFFNDLPVSFLLEVILRSVIMFVVLFIALRSSGKRGVKQLSVFELVLIIALGSAAGDPMFYHDVGIIPAVVVFIIVILLYRAITFMAAKSRKVETLVEGKPQYLVREGRFAVQEIKKEELAQDEFFAELRINNVEHLGQIKYAMIETSGTISILYYEKEVVKSGLPLWPDRYDKMSEHVKEPGKHACVYCGNVEELNPGNNHTCPVCSKKVWVRAMDTVRVS